MADSPTFFCYMFVPLYSSEFLHYTRDHSSFSHRAHCVFMRLISRRFIIT